MIKDFIYRLLERRHFWRYASFSEIAELYTSRMLRFVGMYIASGFASVYLYRSGYSLLFIMIFWSLYFFLKIFLAYFSAYYAARYGPKHAILISNVIYIPAMIALGFVPNFGVWAIIIWGVSMAVSTSVYQLGYTIDFSKVKNPEHAGKELGFMNIVEKLSIGLSPVIGGVIAFYFGPQFVMWTAAVIFMLSALPLLKSSEPTRTHQTMHFRGYPWRATMRSLVAETGIGFDMVATSYVWSIFMAIVVFSNLGDSLYFTIGVLSSVMIVATIAISYAYGRLIDRNRGGDLLTFSVIVNALVHASRPFATTTMSVVYTNITNEVATAGIAMSYLRGMFDQADSSGHRIVYMFLTELMVNVGATIACVVLALGAWLLGDVSGLRVFFFITAGVVLLEGTAKFGIYRR